jgi:D-alanyl-D-alanine carboxypeptidase (penicillin-binding protein 5/6)
MKKIAASLLFIAGVSSATAQSLPVPPIAASSWMLLDETSGQILASQNPDQRIEPASLTKIMTAYLIFSAVQNKEVDLNQTVLISKNVLKIDRGSSKMFLVPGMKVKFNDLVYGLMVQSGNDAAVALAETIAGSESAFVDRMNAQARKLGLSGTHFASPHGLPDPETYSTARDLATLAARLIEDFPDLYKNYDSTKSFTFNHIRQPNRNRLLYSDNTVDGLKTGHTNAAGYCMVASAKRPTKWGDRRLIAVVLGTSSDNARTQESAVLLNWGYTNFDTVKVFARGVPIRTDRVWEGQDEQVALGLNRDLYVTLPREASARIKTNVQTPGPLIAPLAKNEEVGKLQVTLDGKSIAERPLLPLAAVDQAGFFGRTWDAAHLWIDRHS